jgi:hypothetical protein
MKRSPSGPCSPSAAGAACLALSVLAPLAAPGESAAQARPSAPLQEAYFAWDAGDYVAAMESYLQVLTAPGGEAYAREAALLTGELHPVREVDDDGRALQVSPDGRYVAWERQVGTAAAGATANGWVTRVEPLTGGSRVEVPARGVRLSPGGTAAWLDGGRLHLLEIGSGRRQEVALPGLQPLGLAFAPDEEVLYLTAGVEGAGNRLHVARLEAPAWAPRVLELGEGHAANPVPAVGGRHLVFTRPQSSPLPVPEGTEPTPSTGPRVGILDLETGRFADHAGTSPTVSAGGDVVAFLQPGEGGARLVAIPLTGPDGGAEAAPRLLLETPRAVANPAVSPDGRRVAYQARPHTDWEIFLVPTDGSGEEVRVTREIQHDLFPAWITNDLLLAMKGEARHRRAHLYDLTALGPGTADGYELFHNNTLRTIAPQYQWVAHPGGAGVLINAERDGNTISPERAVYWVDLTRTVGHDEVVARVRRNLEAERDLLERGRARFGPLEPDIRAATDAVSVGRVFHYANALYQLGSKFVTQPGNAPAIDYLRETLESWGYEVELQWFEATGRGQGTRTANVVATLPGTENPGQVYVISSHFDSVLPSPGADDNSSGTTALLEAARVLADHPRRATIQFAFLTAEEAGLLGAREFVRRAQADGVHIAGVLNNDMIGWTRSHRLDNTIRYSNDGIRDLQHAAAHLFSGLITYDSRYYRGTDAAVFYDAYGDIVGGIGSYPVLGNPNYHQATDQLETIDHRLVAEVSRTTVATIMLLADGPSRLVGLHVEEEGQGGPVVAWDPSPEAGVTEYRVRVRGADGSWRELAPVPEPRVEIPAGLDAREVAVRARFADGMESFDDARLLLGEG